MSSQYIYIIGIALIIVDSYKNILFTPYIFIYLFCSGDVIGGGDVKAQQQQAVSSLPFELDPGIVTPNGSTHTYVDPFTESTTAQLKQPQMSAVPPPTAPLQANNGDMSGELSQVQKITMEMVAHQQLEEAKNKAMGMPTNNNKKAVPQPKAPPAAAPPKSQPSLPTKKANSAIPGVGAVPQQNKRPRINAVVPGGAKGPSYSFTSSSAAALPQTTASILSAGVGVDKSQTQLDRRRERNRILARRTRLRKKFFFESLQKEVADLQRENAALKSIVRGRLKPDDASTVLTQCNAHEKLPSNVQNQEIIPPPMPSAVPSAGVKKLDKDDFSLIQSIQNSQQCFIITDPSLHDNPIVFASNDFLTLTGYSQEEVLGRNCRFLQGQETSPDKVGQIRKAINAGEDVNVTFANYTSDGKPFWNSLFIAALRDADNNIVNFIGVIVKVPGPEKGDPEYGKILK